MRQQALRAGLDDIDAWFQRILDQLVALIGVAWRRARDLTSTYLIDHAAVEGIALEPTLATWVTDRVVASARVTGPVEFKRNMALYGNPEQARATMARTLPAATSRLILAGERETVTQTAQSSDAIVGWRRVTDADPCAFCAMLASRGAVYLDQGTAAGEPYHDGDECTAEPLYSHEDEPDSVLELQEQWRQATAGTSGAGSVRAFRRYWDARQA